MRIMLCMLLSEKQFLVQNGCILTYFGHSCTLPFSAQLKQFSSRQLHVFSWFYVICGKSVVVGRCYTDNDVKSGRFEFSARRLRRWPLLSIYNAHCDAVKSWRNSDTFEWSVVVLLLVLPFTWRCFFHNIQVINRQLAFKWIPSETSQYS